MFDADYLPLSTDLPMNSRVTQYIAKYREEMVRLTAENRHLKRQMKSIKFHLSEDLNLVYEKLCNVKQKQNSEHDKKIKRIMKDVEYKMKELENEYRKRLNYYKGYTENHKFIDKNYDKVFGKIDPKPKHFNCSYEGVYSGTESEESLMPNAYTYKPPAPAEDRKEVYSNSPLRHRYIPMGNEEIYDRYRTSVEQPY